MKKIISIFVICLSFFVFYFSFSSKSIEERNAIDDVILTIENKTNTRSYTFSSSFEDSLSNSIQNVISFAKENNYVILLMDTKTEEVNSVSTYFIFDPHENQLKFATKSGNTIKFNEVDDHYISTSLTDKGSYDTIDFLDKRNNYSYQNIVRMYSLYEYPKILPEQLHNNIFIFTSDKEEIVKKNINESSIQPYINELIPIESELNENTSNEINMQMLIICFISICLLFVCQMLRNRKEIMIQKMMGTSTYHIVNKQYLKQMVLYASLFIVIICGCYFTFIREIRDVSIPFIQTLVLYVCYFIGFLIFVYLIIFCLIKNDKSVMYLKNTNQVKRLKWPTLCLKLILLIVIFVPLIQFAKDGWNAVIEYSFMIKNESELRNRVYVYSIDARQEIINDDIKNFNIFTQYINDFLQNKGAIYQDFERYEAITMLEDWDIDYKPFISVNKNYLNSYTLIDDKGDVIDLEKIKEETMFLPKNMQDFDKSSTNMYCSSSCDVITVELGTTYYNMSIGANIRKLSDPIVVYQPEALASFGSRYMLNISDKTIENELLKFLDDNQLNSIVTLKNTADDYDLVLEKDKDSLISFVSLLFIYIFIVSIFIFQNIYIYFIGNKKKLVYSYMFGKSFIKRYGDIMLSNMAIYAPLILILYVYKHMLIAEILLCVTIAILLEIVILCYMIRRYERKQMIEVLKGE